MVIEREFTTTMYHQGYIEPHNGTAYWSRDGHLTVWNSSQGPFVFRNQLANVLQIPMQKVTVIPLEIGGGFGGKLYMYLEPLAALLSKKTGKPVKMIDDPRRGLRGHRPHLRHLRPRQDGREEGRHHHGWRGLHGLRGRRLPGLSGRRRHERHLCPVRTSKTSRSTATTWC